MDKYNVYSHPTRVDGAAYGKPDQLLCERAGEIAVAAEAVGAPVCPNCHVSFVVPVLLSLAEKSSILRQVARR